MGMIQQNYNVIDEVNLRAEAKRFINKTMQKIKSCHFLDDIKNNIISKIIGKFSYYRETMKCKGKEKVLQTQKRIIQVSQFEFKNGNRWVKWRCFYTKTVNKLGIMNSSRWTFCLLLYSKNLLLRTSHLRTNSLKIE